MLLETINSLAPTSPSIPTSVGAAIVSGYLLDVLKRLKQVPSVTYYSKRLNTILRVITSGIGTLGVSYTWAAVGSTGAHQLVFNIPAAAVVASGVWHWVVQYGVQHGWETILAIRPQPPINPADPKGDMPVVPVVPAPVAT